MKTRLIALGKSATAQVLTFCVGAVVGETLDSLVPEAKDNDKVGQVIRLIGIGTISLIITSAVFELGNVVNDSVNKRLEA